MVVVYPAVFLSLTGDVVVCSVVVMCDSLMEISYNLVIRALSDAKLEVSEDERTKLEWSALVWIEQVQIHRSMSIGDWAECFRLMVWWCGVVM